MDKCRPRPNYLRTLVNQSDRPSLIVSLSGSTLNPGKLERVEGIEPSSSAWKAIALPLSYTRLLLFTSALISASRVRSKALSKNASWHSRQRPEIVSLTAKFLTPCNQWWRELDLNQRRHSQRIYSPSPLTARASLQNRLQIPYQTQWFRVPGTRVKL